MHGPGQMGAWTALHGRIHRMWPKTTHMHNCIFYFLIRGHVGKVLNVTNCLIMWGKSETKTSPAVCMLAMPHRHHTYRNYDPGPIHSFFKINYYPIISPLSPFSLLSYSLFFCFGFGVNYSSYSCSLLINFTTTLIHCRKTLFVSTLFIYFSG